MTEPKSAAELIDRDPDMRKLLSRTARKQHRAAAPADRAERLATLQRIADLFLDAGRGVPSHIADEIRRLQP